MTEAERHDDRVAESRREQRAHLLPEEEAVGSDDPERQAAEILADSERRTLDPEGTQRASQQTLDDPA